MIVFDLDGTLANCEHRRHFVDPSKRNDCVLYMSNTTKETWVYEKGWDNPETRVKFTPNWQSFYAACDKDKPIEPVIGIFNHYWEDRIHNEEIQIWSGRCESIRNKTLEWVKNHLHIGSQLPIVKMRTIGDSTPDDKLFENWIDDTRIESKWGHKPDIEMVFSSNSNIIKMFRDHGIFVFDCNQDEREL